MAWHVTQAVVLRATRYLDNHLIVQFYTERFGLKSCMVYDVYHTDRSKRLTPSLFDQGNLLQTVLTHSQELDKLEQLKEASVSFVYKTIYRSVPKRMEVISILDLFRKVVREKEINLSLYDFLKNSLKMLDSLEVFSCFFLAFLSKLTRFIGFNPDYKDYPFFNLQLASFEKKIPLVSYLDGETLEAFKTFLFTSKWSYPLSFEDRGRLKKGIDYYYQTHILGAQTH